MKVYEDGSYTARGLPKSFVPGFRKHANMIERVRLYKAYQKMAAGDTSVREGPAKFLVGIVPVHLPYPWYFHHRPVWGTVVGTVSSPLPKQRAPFEQTQLDRGAVSESMGQGGSGAHEIMVGSMPISLRPGLNS